MIELFKALRTAFSGVTSIAEFREATVAVVSDQLGPDLSLFARKTDSRLEPVASDPPGWTDTDDLLAPLSLASSALSRDEAAIVSDRADRRTVPEEEPLSETSTVEYRSLLVAPCSPDAVLVAGASDRALFADQDLERLRHISAYASVVRTEVTSRSAPLEKRLDEVSTVLSHDAKNYLLILQGQLELARTTPETEYFDTMERACTRLEALIDDTETVLRSGERVTEPEPVDLQTVTLQAWDIVRTSETDLYIGSLSPILAERSGVAQIIENLFRNCIEHVGPDVTVWVGMLPDQEGFYIEDNGQGIDPQERDSIFEYGYSSSADNTGFGLNIVQWIVDAHGWEIGVTDGAMGGARFEISGVERPDA